MAGGDQMVGGCIGFRYVSVEGFGSWGGRRGGGEVIVVVGRVGDNGR